MSAPEDRDPPRSRWGETVQPPAGFWPSVKHFLANRYARTVLIILLVVLVVLGIALAISIGNTSKQPGPGASAPAGDAVPSRVTS